MDGIQLCWVGKCQEPGVDWVWCQEYGQFIFACCDCSHHAAEYLAAVKQKQAKVE